MTKEELRKGIKDQAKAWGVWIDKHSRGGLDYDRSSDLVIYANIKNYNFTDKETVLERFPKKYHRFINQITDEGLEDMTWTVRNDQLQIIIEDGLECDDIELLGTYGRSGGWFGIKLLIKHPEEILEEAEEAKTKDELEELSKEIWKFEEAAKALEELEEMAFRWDDTNQIVEFIMLNLIPDWDSELLRDDELKTARRIAKKYGYLLAEEVRK